MAGSSVVRVSFTTPVPGGGGISGSLPIVVTLAHEVRCSHHFLRWLLQVPRSARGAAHGHFGSGVRGPIAYKLLLTFLAGQYTHGPGCPWVSLQCTPAHTSWHRGGLSPNTLSRG